MLSCKSSLAAVRYSSDTGVWVISSSAVQENRDNKDRVKRTAAIQRDLGRPHFFLLLLCSTEREFRLHRSHDESIAFKLQGISNFRNGYSPVNRPRCACSEDKIATNLIRSNSSNSLCRLDGERVSHRSNRHFSRQDTSLCQFKVARNRIGVNVRSSPHHGRCCIACIGCRDGHLGLYLIQSQNFSYIRVSYSHTHTCCHHGNYQKTFFHTFCFLS